MDQSEDLMHTRSIDIDDADRPLTEPNRARMKIVLIGTMPLNLAAWFVWNPAGKQEWIAIRIALETTFRLHLEDANEQRTAATAAGLEGQ